MFAGLEWRTSGPVTLVLVPLLLVVPLPVLVARPDSREAVSSGPVNRCSGSGTASRWVVTSVVGPFLSGSRVSSCGVVVSVAEEERSGSWGASCGIAGTASECAWPEGVSCAGASDLGADGAGAGRGGSLFGGAAGWVVCDLAVNKANGNSATRKAKRKGRRFVQNSSGPGIHGSVLRSASAASDIIGSHKESG
jgi:hypothetical protein